MTLQIAAGQWHTFVILSNGELVAAGDNRSGQIDRSLGAGRLAATQAVQLKYRFRSVSAGRRINTAVLVDGSTLIWGWNSNALRWSRSETPDAASDNFRLRLPSVAATSAGGSHCLLLQANGTTICGGANGSGQLGIGFCSESEPLQSIHHLGDISAIASGGYHSLAMRTDGSILGWGANGWGQTGTGWRSAGVVVNIESPKPVRIDTDTRAIAAGEMHSLALTTGGSVWSWGRNFDGQLGLGDLVDRDRPAHIEHLPEAIAIAAGNNHSLALTSTGEVYSWGHNIHGQLGVRERARVPVPVRVEGIVNAVEVAAGGQHSAALLERGIVVTWGNNQYGQLGNPSPSRSASVFRLDAGRM